MKVQFWESAASAVQFNVGNLIAIVDVNKLRNDGENSPYDGLIDLKNIWSSFGWHVLEVNGHDHYDIITAFNQAKSVNDKPVVILANTTKGKGISFMENNNDWHHNRITQKLYNKIIEEWVRHDHYK